MKVDERVKKMDEMINSYVEELSELTNKAQYDEKIKEFLNTMKAFYRYSPRNQVLILIQKPESTFIRGFKQWKKLGRHVKYGEKGISILAPSIKKYEKEVEVVGDDGNTTIEMQEFSYTRYFMVYVYDISQTEGKDLTLDYEYKEQTNNHPEILKTFEIALSNKGISVNYVNLKEGLHGYTDGKEITINSKYSIDDKLQTLIHEYAHFVLHFKDDSKLKYTHADVETHAETVAFVVCKLLGIQPPKAENYLVVHGSSKEKIMDSIRICGEGVHEVMSLIPQLEKQIVYA